MWIMRLIGDCPSCGGKQCYGNVSVRKDHILRACRACRQQFLYPLPPVRKKVLYLDQFFYSHAFRGQDNRFREAAERVKHASHLQLLTAPYSPVHEDETHLWRGHAGQTRQELMVFIKLTSRGARFERDYALELTQILKAFDAFLVGADPAYKLARSDAIEADLDVWEDYLFVDIDGYWRDIEKNRQLKAEAAGSLVDAFDAWQNSTASFDQDVDLEYRDTARIYFDLYRTKLERIARGDADAFFDSPIRVRVLEHLLQQLPEDMPPIEQLETCREFFQSEHFRQVPFEWLSARMFATLKSLVRRGEYSNRDRARQRLGGFLGDLTHVSRYAPYCDAFVMDNAMAALVRQPTVRLEDRYGVKVFSRSNWGEFLAWLDGLADGMSDEHRASVEAAYGEW